MKCDKLAINMKSFWYFIAGSSPFILGDEFKAMNFWCSYKKILGDKMRRWTSEKLIDPSEKQALEE